MSGASPGLWHSALLALLPLTGFLVFHSDREELPWPARAALGTAWVISLLTIAVFLLHLVGITPSAVRILFIAIPAVVLFRRRAGIFGRPPGLSGRESLWLALSLIAVAALAFGPHFTYRFPLHADEYWHAAFANKIIETRHLFFANLSMRIVHMETGFHALLAGILLLTGLDPLTQYGFLAALLATLTALALYALLREITGAGQAGLSAALLYGTLASDNVILGPNFFTPYMTALYLLLVLWLSLARWVKTRDQLYLWTCALVGCAMVTIHGSLALLSVPLLSLWLLAEGIPIKRFAPYLLAPLLAGAGMLYFSYPNESLTATLQFLRAKMLFATGAPIHAENYFGHVTPPLFALAVAGLAYLWMKKKSSWLIASSAVILYFLFAYQRGAAYLIRPERLFFLAVVFSVILAALGLHYLTAKVPQKYRTSAAALALCLVAAFQFHGRSFDVFSQYILERDYPALLWLKDHYQDSLVLSPPGLGLAIPLSGNRAASPLPLTDHLPDHILRVVDLFDNSPDCDSLKAALAETGAEIVLSREPWNCPFLSPVYEQDDFIYKSR